MSINAKITAAFKSLRKAGFFAKQNHTCCQSCGCEALPEGTKNYVFYHRQDANDLKKTGKCFLSWGGDGEKIKAAALEVGLKVEWDGSPETRILVSA